MTKLLLGADPEVFVRKKGAKRFFQSAHGLNDGTKEAPVKVENGAVQVDGMALEFNIDPTETSEQFLYNVKSVMSQMEESLPKHLEIVATPVAHFTKKHMEEQPECAKELGCNPDWNAWSGQQNPRPNGDNVSFRTGAGHIHFGWTNNEDVENPLHKKDCELLVKALDNTLGSLATLFDPGVKRRKLYGAAGAYRIKPYGCEYRVLSNAWLQDDELILWVADTSRKVFDMLCDGSMPRYLAEYEQFYMKTLSEKNPRKFEKRLSPLCKQIGLQMPPERFYV